MNSNNNDRLTEKLKLRESLTKKILADVEYEINDVLAWAPESLTKDDRKAIRDEVNAQTRHVTDALTTEELQNEGARRSYACRAVADARYLVNVRTGEPPAHEIGKIIHQRYEKKRWVWHKDSKWIVNPGLQRPGLAPQRRIPPLRRRRSPLVMDVLKGKGKDYLALTPRNNHC